MNLRFISFGWSFVGELEAEHELGALKVFRLESYEATKFLNYHLAYHETQTDSLSVTRNLRVLDRGKHFEQLLLVLILYSNSRVSDEDFNLLFVFEDSFDLDAASTTRKLDGILKQT